MITISLCMIVKNEEEDLAKCLDSIADLMDEIIIVDTGSTDKTKEIAAKYTDKIYDFEWHNDFSAARNYSFSLATKDYIYTADADEILDSDNREAFRKLKAALIPEVEIVQMLYHTVGDFNTVLNVQRELRPKLYKRIRTFTWVDPIHETVRLDPVVFDSDVEILHMPKSMHSKRDFSIFANAYKKQGSLSDKIVIMYAKELLKTGEIKDFIEAAPIFMEEYVCSTNEDIRKIAACVLARKYRLNNNAIEFFKLTLKDMLTTPCSEICYELGSFFLKGEDYEESAMWFYNAAFESGSILDIHTSGDLALEGLCRCYEAMIKKEEENPSEDENFLPQLKSALENYQTLAESWTMPVE